MLAFSSRKAKRGGGSVQQPLAYLDPTLPVPNAPSGTDILGRQGLIVRPAIGQQGGGSTQEPLQYLDPTIPTPSASSGSNLLVQNDLILRPRIGGFLPSIMKGVVNSGAYVAPLAAIAAKRMLYDTRKKGGGKKEDWAHNREAAKEELSKYGKPSALNVNKYAALKRKDEDSAEEWLTEYIVKKRKTAKKGSKKANKSANKTEKKPKKAKKEKKAKEEKEIKTAELWNDLVARAKKNLGKFGKPSGPNIYKFASMKKKGVNTAAFLANYKTRKQFVEPTVKSKREQYRENQQEARRILSQYGKPTVANVTKFVSLKRQQASTAAVEEAVKQRVQSVKAKEAPAAVVAAAATPVVVLKPDWATTYSKAKANLTAIKEKPKAYQIATLASIRRKGLSNAEFLQKYGK